MKKKLNRYMCKMLVHKMRVENLFESSWIKLA